MKKIYLQTLLDFLPDDTEIYIRVGDKAWPVREAHIFNDANILYLEHTAGEHRNFPEDHQGVEEIPIPKPYDPDYEQDAPCGACTHPYYRHFDPFEYNAPVGCKYCSCYIFQEE